jgi:DNA-binding response OmpR family regulator
MEIENKKILIVEDEVSIAELERDYLEISGYAVELVHSGQKAVTMIRSNPYDLIILDLMLPEIDGFSIIKAVRNDVDVPILMVTAKKEDIDKIRGLGLGADDFITKPFSPSELVARVKAHLARYERLTHGGVKKKEVTIRNLTIQLDARRVLVNNKEVNLTTKEYDILVFFANNPDQVFSKEIILDRIWGLDSYVDTATVTVHIGKLRDKIPDGFIETVWGAGYRFNIG